MTIDVGVDMLVHSLSMKVHVLVHKVDAQKERHVIEHFNRRPIFLTL